MTRAQRLAFQSAAAAQSPFGGETITLAEGASSSEIACSRLVVGTAPLRLEDGGFRPVETLELTIEKSVLLAPPNATSAIITYAGKTWKIEEPPADNPHASGWHLRCLRIG